MKTADWYAMALVYWSRGSALHVGGMHFTGVCFYYVVSSIGIHMQRPAPLAVLNYTVGGREYGL